MPLTTTVSKKILMIFFIFTIIQCARAETLEEEIEKLRKVYQKAQNQYFAKIIESLKSPSAVKIDIPPNMILSLFESRTEEDDQKSLMNLFPAIDSNQETTFNKFAEWFEKDFRRGLQKTLLAFACWATTGETYSTLLSKPDNFRKYGTLFSHAFSISNEGKKAVTEAATLSVKYCDLTKTVDNHLASYTSTSMLEKLKMISK
uniref:Putative 20.2 kDa salivary peptide n=1 Tax=Culex quinquefasciatus TaxID=7176 RepID=Q6TRX7_CULQU|nr:putative 20.2 kDa salivary peptide [Culex quinquefasciatus]